MRPFSRSILTLIAAVSMLPACPRGSNPATRVPGSLPRSLEGFELGASQDSVLSKLKRGGFTTEQINPPGARVTELRARPKAEHPRLLYVGLSFTDMRLFSVRVGFKPAAEGTGKALAAACAKEKIIGGGGFYVQCLDAAEKLILSAQRSGERVSIIDLERAIAAGVTTREKLKKLVAEAPTGGFVRRVLGESKATGPLSRVHEGVQLGDTRSNALLPFQPPTWSLRTTTRERRGGRYRQVLLRSKTHRQLSDVSLEFDEAHHKLVRARFTYKSADETRAADLKARCQGHVYVAGRVNRTACRHEWETLLSFRDDAKTVLLVDLATALTTGLLTKAEVDPSAPPDVPPKQ